MGLLHLVVVQLCVAFITDSVLLSITSAQLTFILAANLADTLGAHLAVADGVGDFTEFVFAKHTVILVLRPLLFHVFHVKLLR